VYCFGHAGDQNLHLNVILRLQEEDLLADEQKVDIKHTVKRDLEHAVLTETMKWNGSISAEHGIGQQKSHLLDKSRTAAEVDMMKLLKQSLDPKCILNPGKVIPFK
jgi:FAD/FMN-containing dehydrogenase